MQIIDLFSGVGGFSIAGHQLGWETILFCEKELFPQQVLRERFPGVPIFDDVCKLTGETINGLIQSDRPIIQVGGWPCQPFSVAGAREGTNDVRHLWPEYFRIIKEIRPDYIIGENVPGLLSIEWGVVFEQVCLDLESEGYEVQAFVLPACATGAPHRRDRVWIVGYSKEAKQQRSGSSRTRGIGLADTDSGITTYTNEIRIDRCGPPCNNESWKSESCEQSGNGRTGEVGRYVSERINSDTHESGLRREGNPEQQSTGATGNYWHDWPSISPFHSGHDGLSPELVRHIRTNLAEAGETPENIEAYIRKEANWIRKQAIMAAGNAVVPTVVLQIMKAIQYHYDLPRPNPINHIHSQETRIKTVRNG